MRNTWIILLLTAAVAAAMYFYFTRKAELVSYDVITISNTPDSILGKIKIYTADDPLEVFYRDSSWSLADSTPLKRIVVTGISDSVSRSYREKTLFISYDDKWFYDMEIRKADTTLPYRINLEFVKQNDSMFVQGNLDQQKAVLRFRNPMTAMFKSFVITYNDRLPDSVKNDTTRDAPKTQATKIITVLEP